MTIYSKWLGMVCWGDPDPDQMVHIPQVQFSENGGLKAELRRGRGYMFFSVMLFRPIQGLRDLSFFGRSGSRPRGVEEGRMMPAERESLIYFSMASLSVSYNRLDGRVAPVNRLMVQSYGRSGGCESSRSLLKTSF